MDWLHRVTTRLVAAFAVPLVVPCVVSALAYRNTDHLERNSAQVVSSEQAVAELARMRSTRHGLVGQFKY